MGLFHKKNEKAQIKDALEELNKNLASVHASVARVRAEESRARVKLQNAENELEDQKRYLARAKQEGRPTDSYETKISEIQKKVDKLRAEHEQAVENLEHVESLEKELETQRDQVAYLKKEQDSLLDDAYYYAEEPMRTTKTQESEETEKKENGHEE